MKALADIGTKTTVTNNTYNDTTPTYSIKAKNDEFFLISQISVGADGSFLTDGYLQITINDEAITNNSSALQEIQLISNWSMEFKEKDFIFVEPQCEIVINARVATGKTGVVQMAVTGTTLTRDEFEKLKKKFLGDR